MMLPRIHHALRMLRLLALLEHSPKYGRQIARLAPELFFADKHVVIRRDRIDRVPTQNIYMTLARLQRAGLIRRRDHYVPPKGLDVPARGKVAWYELTPQGRAALRTAREALKVYIGEP